MGGSGAGWSSRPGRSWPWDVGQRCVIPPCLGFPICGSSPSVQMGSSWGQGQSLGLPGTAGPPSQLEMSLQWSHGRTCRSDSQAPCGPVGAPSPGTAGGGMSLVPSTQACSQGRRQLCSCSVCPRAPSLEAQLALPMPCSLPDNHPLETAVPAGLKPPPSSPCGALLLYREDRRKRTGAGSQPASSGAEWPEQIRGDKAGALCVFRHNSIAGEVSAAGARLCGGRKLYIVPLCVARSSAQCRLPALPRLPALGVNLGQPVALPGYPAALGANGGSPRTQSPCQPESISHPPLVFTQPGAAGSVPIP